MLSVVNKLLKTKSLLTSPSNVLPLHFKQTFPPIIWIFTEGEGDAIESRLPFKKNSTLPEGWPWQNFDTMSHHTHFMQRRLPIENNQITIANMPLNFVATLQMQIRRLGMKSQIDSFTWKGKKNTFSNFSCMFLNPNIFFQFGF